MAKRAPQFHQALRLRTVNPENRPNAARRGYNGAWQRARLAFLQEHPLCEECQRTGRIVASDVVDHITPHKGDMQLFWDSSNWQALCKPCHSRKTAAKDGGFGNPNK